MTVIVLVDLYDMHYSKTCYQTKHFPHMIVVDHIDRNSWFVRDPFYNWEGYLPALQMYHALSCDRMSLGITVDRSRLHEADRAEFSVLFKQHNEMKTSALIVELEKMLMSLMANENSPSFDKLFASIEHIRIMSQRWKGYYVVLSYFSEHLAQQPSKSKDLASVIIGIWDSFVLSAVRISMLQKVESLQSLRDKLHRLKHLEAELKQSMDNLFKEWEGNDAYARFQKNPHRLCERKPEATE